MTVLRHGSLWDIWRHDFRNNIPLFISWNFLKALNSIKQCQRVNISPMIDGSPEMPPRNYYPTMLLSNQRRQTYPLIIIMASEDIPRRGWPEGNTTTTPGRPAEKPGCVGFNDCPIRSATKLWVFVLRLRTGCAAVSIVNRYTTLDAAGSWEPIPFRAKTSSWG